MVLYKTGKQVWFVHTVHVACKFETKKPTIQFHMKDFQSSILLKTQNEEESIWEFSQRLVPCGSILHGNSYYTVVASILVPSAASCRTKLCEVKSVSS